MIPDGYIMVAGLVWDCILCDQYSWPPTQFKCRFVLICRAIGGHAIAAPYEMADIIKPCLNCGSYMHTSMQSWLHSLVQSFNITDLWTVRPWERLAHFIACTLHYICTIGCSHCVHWCISWTALLHFEHAHWHAVTWFHFCKASTSRRWLSLGACDCIKCILLRTVRTFHCSRSVYIFICILLCIFTNCEYLTPEQCR